MALKVDLPQALTSGYVTKRHADAPSTLVKALQGVAKAHVGVDWALFDLPGGALKTEDLASHQDRLKVLQRACAGAVADAVAAAGEAVGEADKALAALKKGKSASKAALAVLQEVQQSGRSYAADLRKKTEAAVAAFAQQVATAEEQARKAGKAAAATDGAGDAVRAKALKLLRSRTVPLLRGLPGRRPEMPPPAFMAGIGPVSSAVMLNKAVGGTEKNILNQLLAGQKGIKFFRGVAIWEAKAVTFVSAAPVSGAAKKLQASLVKLVKLRLKVRVRKPDGVAEEAEGDAAADPSRIADEPALLADTPDDAEFASPDSQDHADADAQAQAAPPPAAPQAQGDAAAPAAHQAAAEQARVATLQAQLLSLCTAIGKRLAGGGNTKAVQALKRIDAQRKAAAAWAPAKAAAALAQLLEAAKAVGTQVGAPARPAGASPDPLAAGAPAAGPGDPPAPVEGDTTAQPAPVSAAGDATAPAAATSGDPAFDARRAEVQKLLDALNAAPNSFHVAGEVATIEARLKAADSAAQAKDFATAMSEAAAAKAAADAAKGFLSQYDAFAEKRDEVSALVNALAASSPDWNAKPFRDAIVAAGALVEPSKRDFTKAMADLNQGVAQFSKLFRTICLDDLKPKVAALKTHPQAKAIEAEVKKLEALLALQEPDLNARAWRKARLRADVIFNTALRLQGQADRGGAYADLRKTVTDQLAQVIKLPTLKTLQVELARALKEADAIGNPQEGRWEDGVDALKALQERLRAARQLDTESQTWTRERGEAEAELGKVLAHPAAARVSAESQAVRRQIDAAMKLALDSGAVGAPVMLQGLVGPQDFAAARRGLLRSWADVQTALALADSLKGTAAAQATLAAKPDATKAAQLALTLRDQYSVAANAPFADLAQPELVSTKASLDEADKALAAKTLPAALKALDQAVLNLEAARRRQVEQSRVQAMHGVVVKQRDALAKGPHGKALKPRLADLTQSLDAVMQAMTNADYPGAMAQLRIAQDRARTGEADALVLDGLAQRSQALGQELAAPDAKAVKAAVDKTIKAADKAAAALQFGQADQLLRKASGQIKAARVKQLAKAGKDSAGAVERQAREMIDAAGPGAVDDLIKEIDPKVAPEVLAALAKARFDCDIVVDKGKDPQQSIKRMCELMAKVPDDVKGNPSLKKIVHRDTPFPFYQQAEKGVVMNSRPRADGKPEFSKKGAKDRLPEREKDCEPANTKAEDLFDFNMLHELAHSIDDAKGYMAQHMGASDHGGWIDHGADIDAVAKVVGKHFKFTGDPRQHAYIVDVILGNSPVYPEAPKGQEEAWANAMVDIMGWAQKASAANVWDNQAACNAITLEDGRIYHQAYPNAWFSYDASARKRGITSYQFRAPGEWFSELYAAYKMDKLKPSHPAVKWLATLKI